jgi:hypothetical protein
MGREIKKCVLPRFCVFMEKALDDTLANERRRGLTVVEVTKISTMKTRVLCVAYKKGARDPGIALNFCPFCGGDIAPKSKTK